MDNGFEVVHGDILLDNGLIIAVGDVDPHVLYSRDDVVTIDANGAWASPGYADIFYVFTQTDRLKLRIPMTELWTCTVICKQSLYGSHVRRC